MDEMQLLRDFGQRELPGHADIAPAREKLLAAAAQEHPPQHGQDELARRRSRGRKRFALIGAGAVAAAAAAVLVVVPLGGQAPQASATEVLHRAADAARAQPDTDPAADQFLYKKVALPDDRSYEVWLSVDGTRDGRYLEDGESNPVYGCRDGRRTTPDPNGDSPGTTECEPDPAVRTGLPTDPEQMLTYLVESTNAVPDGAEPRAEHLAKDFLVLLGTLHGEPESRAALFEAFATLPDIEVVPEAEDAAGRSGIGIKVAGSDSETGTVMVFDPQTYEYLGSGYDAVIDVGIVDKVGQRP